MGNGRFSVARRRSMDLKMSAKCYVFLHMDPSYIMGKNCSIYGSQKILGLACTLKMDQSKSFLCS